MEPHLVHVHTGINGTVLRNHDKLTKVPFIDSATECIKASWRRHATCQVVIQDFRYINSMIQ